MKKRHQSMAALFVACSMTLSLFAGPEGSAVRAAERDVVADVGVDSGDSGVKLDVGVDSDGSGVKSDVGVDSGDSEIESGDSGETDESVTDQETGYTYVLYEEKGTQVQKAEITGYTGSDTELTIPAKVGEYDVGSIGEVAFKENAKITSVVIPEGVCRIGFEAFFGCEKLASVTVPSTVTDWDDHASTRDEYGDFNDKRRSRAFEGCLALTEVKLSEGLTILGERAFCGCTSLASVTIPSTIEEFHSKVFYGCTALRRVELKEGMKQIGCKAFGECTALEEVTIPSTIEKWATTRAPVMMTAHNSEPFYGCTSLVKVTFAEGLKTLYNFSGLNECPQATELEIPASVENTEWAFADCTYLKKVTLHDGIETIGENAFQNCSALEDVRIPNTVTAVMKYAFQYCTSLERLVFPPLLNNIQEGSTTNGCTSLKELYILSETVQYYQKLEMAEDGKIYCPEGSDTYNKFLAGLPDADKGKLAAIPGTGVEAERSIYYNGKAQDGVILKGTQDGDEILYRMEDGDWQTEIPQVTELGTYNMEVIVKRLQTEQPQYSHLKVQVRVIKKRQYTMHLSDLEAKEGEDYTVPVEGYRGTEQPVFTYYSDADCQVPLGGKPETAGVYYVRATVAETKSDAPVESNVAKITIIKVDVPGTDPGASADPGTNPGASQKPGTDPGTSTDPGTDPGASQKPGTDPGTSAAPSTEPGVTQKPGGNQDPGVKPKQTEAPGKQTAPNVKKVTVKTVKSTKKKTLQVQWKKVSGAAGYQVQLATNKKFTKGKKSYLIAKGKTTKKTIKKLKRKKTYYVRIRAYQMYQGKKKYGGWSKVKKVKVK